MAGMSFASRTGQPLLNRMSTRRRLVLLLCLGAAAVHAQPARPQLSEASRLIVDETNAFRRAHGAGNTVSQPQLADAALEFARFMARTDRYSHEADGKTPVQRSTAHGYRHCVVLENIAFVQSSAGFRTGELAQRLVAGWQQSPGHRKNMLDPAVTETGVAIAQSPRSNRFYAVQMFGRPWSQAIEFALTNHSVGTVDYELDGEAFRLAPRQTHTHQRCRPPRVEVAVPGAAPLRLAPAHGARYVLSGGKGEPYRLQGE